MKKRKALSAPGLREEQMAGHDLRGAGIGGWIPESELQKRRDDAVAKAQKSAGQPCRNTVCCAPGGDTFAAAKLEFRGAAYKMLGCGKGASSAADQRKAAAEKCEEYFTAQKPAKPAAP